MHRLHLLIKEFQIVRMCDFEDNSQSCYLRMLKCHIQDIITMRLKSKWFFYQVECGRVVAFFVGFSAWVEYDFHQNIHVEHAASRL